MQKVVIIGAGGHGREVLDIFDAVNQVVPQYEVLGFVVEAPHGRAGVMVNGRPILGDFDWLEGRENEVRAIAAVGAPQLRRRLAQRAADLGVRFCTVVHPSAHLTRWVELGEGVVIAAGCILTNQVRLGDHVHVNLGCTISHDSVLEDLVYLSPGVHVAGRVTVGEGCYVGTGASIIDGRRVGAWSIVGAGSVVIADVPADSTVVGVPARVVKQREAGWHLA